MKKNMEKLFSNTVLEYVEKELQQISGQIVFDDLANYLISPIGNQIGAIDTAVSDGVDIVIHNKCSNKAIAAWDALHLLGHMTQWHMTKEQAAALGFKYYGKNAQNLAIEDFVGAGESDLIEMQQYEIEANSIGLWYLHHITNEEVILEQATDYAAKDLQELTEIYAGKDFIKKYDHLLDHSKLSNLIKPMTAPSFSDMKAARMPELCVPVIHC